MQPNGCDPKQIFNITYWSYKKLYFRDSYNLIMFKETIEGAAKYSQVSSEIYKNLWKVNLTPHGVIFSGLVVSCVQPYSSSN